MKGNNTFELCQVAMIEAMQHYLDNVVFKEAGKARVRSVKANNGVGSPTFEISLSAEESADG